MGKQLIKSSLVYTVALFLLPLHLEVSAEGQDTYMLPNYIPPDQIPKNKAGEQAWVNQWDQVVYGDAKDPYKQELYFPIDFGDVPKLNHTNYHQYVGAGKRSLVYFYSGKIMVSLFRWGLIQELYETIQKDENNEYDVNLVVFDCDVKDKQTKKICKDLKLYKFPTFLEFGPTNAKYGSKLPAGLRYYHNYTPVIDKYGGINTYLS